MVDKELEMCPLCHNVENIKRNAGLVECPFCGIFTCDAMANDLLTNCPDEFNDEQRLKVRYVVKKRHLENLNNNQNLGVENLTETRIKEINDTYNIPNLLDKAKIVLGYLIKETRFFGDTVKIDTNTLFPLFYCKNNTELYNILIFLSDSNLCNIPEQAIMPSLESSKHNKRYYQYNFNISRSFYEEYCDYMLYPQYNVAVTSKGIEYMEENNSSIFSKQAFVAMWFNTDENIKECKYNMQKVYTQAIEPAISQSKDKYTAMKIDCKEHCNDINDEMIAEIRKSKFLIADLTGYRGGVYFEAGFAYGLGIPVIYTCNSNWLDTIKDNTGKIIREGVHFDLSHRNMILWDYDNLDEFKNALRKRIEAVII